MANIKAMSHILRDASKIRKKEDRIQFLRQNYSNKLHLLLSYMFDPRVKFKLPVDDTPESDPPYTPMDAENTEHLLYHEVKRLYIFCERPGDNLSENRRQFLFIRMLESVHPDDAKLLLGVVRKQSPYKGINKDLIDQAYGEYRD